MYAHGTAGIVVISYYCKSPEGLQGETTACVVFRFTLWEVKTEMTCLRTKGGLLEVPFVHCHCSRPAR